MYLPKHSVVLSVALLAGLVFAQVLAEPSPAFAAKTKTLSEEVNFSVQALLPASQRNHSVSYFDLRLKPRQTERLRVRVTNTGTASKHIRVAAIAASTNGNGIIDYTKSGIVDPSLRHPFNQLARVINPDFTLKGGASHVVTIEVAMPADRFDGVILGGIHIMDTGDLEQHAAPKPSSTSASRSASTSASGTTDHAAAQDNAISAKATGLQAGDNIAIQNRYSYALGVVLSETDAPVSPQARGEEAYATLDNGYIVVIHEIRNTAPAIAKQWCLHIEVTRKGDNINVLREIDNDNVSMAPNSMMPYTLFWDGGIAAGDYVSHITLRDTFGDVDDLSFDLPWSISATQAATLNSAAVDAPAPTFPWVWVAIIVALLAVIAVLLIMIKKHREHEVSTSSAASE